MSGTELRAYFANRQMVLQSYVRADRGSTHWDGCEISHINCALAEGADALRRAGELAQVNAALVEALKAFEDITRHPAGTYVEVSDAEWREVMDQARAVLARVEKL